MNNKANHEESSYQELTFLELVKVIWEGKVTVIATTVIVIVLGVLYALSLPNMYKAEALLSPTEEARGGGMSQMAGELGGLASLAGFNLNQSSIDKTKIALEILQSREFIANFVAKYNLTADIMAVKDWTAEEGLVYRDDLYDASNNQWLKNEETGESLQPSAHQIVKRFNDGLVEVQASDKSGFVTLAVVHLSPNVAKEITDLLVQEINDTMRRRDIAEAKRSLQYLDDELRKTPLTDMQQVFFRLIEKQTQTVMLANTRPEYIFQTLDPAVIPEERYKPNRKIIAILSAFFGGFLGIAIVLGLNRVRKLMN